MSSINLTDVNSGYNLGKINQNFTEIERVINEELLHRVNDDGSPNTLQADIDANSRRLFNLPKAITGGEPLRLKDLFGSADELIGGPTREEFTAISNQTVFTLATSYVVGTNSIYVFRNGVLMSPTEYVESGSNTITLNTEVDSGDIITVVPVAVGGTSESSNTTATSLGAGSDVYKQKIGDTLQFRSLVAGTNVTLTEGTDSITINASASGSGSGEANTTSNLGTGTGLAATKTGVNLPFKSISPGIGMTFEDDGSTVVITNNSPASSISAINLGSSGEGVYASKLGSELRFKKLIAGTNVTLSGSSDAITISSSGGGGSSSLGLFNVKDYGALGNNSTDDTTAVNAAISAAIAAGGGAVWFPNGKYILSSAITATFTNGVGLALLGSGVDVTELKFTSGSGITLNCVSEGYWAYPGSGISHGNAITVNGMTLSTAIHNTGTALTISANTFTGRPVPAINISNVTLRGTDVAKGWARGIYFDRADAASVSHLNWFGKIATAEGTVVEIAGDATHNVSAFRFNNCGWTYANIGVKAASYVEGIHINNTDMVLVNKGVEWLCGSTVESELAMSNTHIAATLYCVHIQGLMDSHITNSLFFVSGSPTTWNGIRMDYSAATISNCFFGGSNGASNVGIVNTNLVTGSNSWAYYHPTSIVNCSFRAMPVGISLGIYTGNVFVGADNQYSGEVTTRINNSSTTSLVEKRTYAGSTIPTLTGGSTSETISVAIPANTYATAPEAGFLTLAQNAEDLIGFYLFDPSTATNAQFLIKRRDGGVLPSGARRFSFSIIGI